MSDVARLYPPSRAHSPTVSERVLAFLFLLTYASLGTKLYLDPGASFTIIPVPYLGSNITWPVLAVLGFCSLVLFGRFAFSTLFAFLQLVLFGALTFLLFQNRASILLPAFPLVGPHIPWFVGAIVTFFSFWLFVRKLIPRE